MATYIYDTETKLVLRETKKVVLGENEASVVDPDVAPDTDLEAPLVYDNGVLRNQTVSDAELHDTTRKQRAKDKLIATNKQWRGHTVEGIIFTRALRNVMYEQLIRIRDGQPLESVEQIHTNLSNAIDNWDEFDDCMHSKKHVVFKDVAATEGEIAKMRQRAKDYQTNSNRFLSSKAACRAFYDQIKRHEDGLEIESAETVYGANFEAIIDAWTIDEDTL